MGVNIAASLSAAASCVRRTYNSGFGHDEHPVRRVGASPRPLRAARTFLAPRRAHRRPFADVRPRRRGFWPPGVVGGWDQAASCTCHHPAALWAWRSAGSLCSWLWCGDADTCCCMSVAQIGGFHCQSFVDVGLSLSFKVLWNLRFVLRGTHSLPTPHAYPVSRSAASAIRGSVETPETNGAIVLDRTANICSMAIVRNTRFVPCRATRRGRAWLFWQSRRGQKTISRRSLRLALRMP